MLAALPRCLLSLCSLQQRVIRKSELLVVLLVVVGLLFFFLSLSDDEKQVLLWLFSLFISLCFILVYFRCHGSRYSPGCQGFASHSEACGGAEGKTRSQGRLSGIAGPPRPCSLWCPGREGSEGAGGQSWGLGVLPSLPGPGTRSSFPSASLSASKAHL